MGGTSLVERFSALEDPHGGFRWPVRQGMEEATDP
jgi:hypothetical protein